LPWSSLEELNRKIDALEQKIGANEALLERALRSNDRDRELAIRQQISTDTARLTALEQERREVRLQQQQQAGE
jgi:hypothetical protein